MRYRNVSFVEFEQFEIDVGELPVSGAKHSLERFANRRQTNT
jgi:hypothetical protein